MQAAEAVSMLNQCCVDIARVRSRRETLALLGRSNRALAMSLLFMGCLYAHADSGRHWQPGGTYVQFGAGENDVRATTAGLAWPWRNWARDSGGLQFSGSWDLYGLQVRSRARDGGKLDTLVLGLSPMLRATPAAAGQEHWFIEGGVGLAVSDGPYASGDRFFSTRFNFVTSVGAGWVLGRSQEVSLRIAHASNAGIRQPNPGENLLQLRYLYRWGASTARGL